MESPSLLAVVEVPYADRVRCSAQGCGHSVYRRVHLVREASVTRVYGSDCFSRHFGSTHLARSSPHYSSVAGRALTPEERQLLINNTERLIELFEAERLAAIAKVESRRVPPPPERPLVTLTVPVQQKLEPSREQRGAAEIEARRNLAEKFPGVDLSLPGFKGLLRLEIEKVLRKNAA